MKVSEVRRVWALTCVLAVFGGLGSCSERSAQPTYSLVEKKDDNDSERLRKMQMVRTLTINGDATETAEMQATELRDDLKAMCQQERNCQVTYQYAPCAQLACKGIVELCVANYLTEMAGIRATPFKIRLEN